MARLVVLEPKASKGTAIGLTQEVTFGRSENCTVSVPDDTFVSQVHARVVQLTRESSSSKTSAARMAPT